MAQYFCGKSKTLNDLFHTFRYSVERGMSTKEIDARLAILEAEELEKKKGVATVSS
jgi:hypothetical protein